MEFLRKRLLSDTAGCLPISGCPKMCYKKRFRAEWTWNTDEEWKVMNRSRLFSFCPHSLFCSLSCEFCVFND